MTTAEALELDALRARLADTEETLRAIRHGEVDALVVGAVVGQERLFTLTSADRTYRNFVEGMSDGAATVSAGGIVLYANQALADLVGSTCSRIVGKPILGLLADSSRSRVAEVLAPDSPSGSVEAVLTTTEGHLVPVLIGASALMVEGDHLTCLTVTDLTSERQAEAALAHSAQHDALTGLPNRTLLTDRVQHALERRASGPGLLALMFCDVDGFKNVNDAYGHQVGDGVLHAIAQRLTDAVRPEDTVARIGGDEFVVLCEDLADMDAAAMVAARLSSAVGLPIPTSIGVVEATVSIGVAVAGHGEEASSDTLLRDADEAMYKAKRQGPNVIELFDDTLRTVAASRLELLTELRRATANGELRLVYQPVMDIATQSVVGVEALMRWQSPTKGLVPPDEFIPFAERSGLIIQMGAWAVREACRQGAAWLRAGRAAGSLSMSVNVSGRQLTHAARLVDTVKVALEDTGLDPQALVLEVTESALMDDAEVALRVVNELKELGVRIAIDDFGTGYSSLLYLKRFPVDLLKVDRSFVDGLGANREDSAIVRSVIDLAHAFDIMAVAEGIETEEQLSELQRLGCHFGQGFLWSPGRSADELTAALGGGSAGGTAGGTVTTLSRPAPTPARRRTAR
jgi:diguanylate cyclase (GGDEF)-like protein/PAS domain S-box-containing protein